MCHHPWWLQCSRHLLVFFSGVQLLFYISLWLCSDTWTWATNHLPDTLGGNILDLLFVIPQVSSPACVSNLLTSDHIPICFELSFSARPPRSKSYSWKYSYKKTDFEGINSFLFDYDFSHLYDSTDSEFSWLFFKKALLTAISLFTPLVKVKSTNLPRWFTPNIRPQIPFSAKAFSTTAYLHRLTFAECLLEMHEARSSHEWKETS